MVMEKVIKVILSEQYIPLGSNLKEIGLFYKKADDKMNVVAVVKNYDKLNYTGEELSQISFQIERKFLLQGNRNVNIQYVVLSDDPDRDRKISETEGIHFWIVDLIVNRLIVYEDETPEFESLQKSIEQELTIGHSEEVKVKRKVPIINIILICINMAIFLIMELNGSTNSTSYMIKHGASSWKLVFEHNEYYRLFTCMFLHFGISHLLNNMFSLLVIGNEVEKMYGKINYLLIYVVSGIGASCTSAFYYMHRGEQVVSAGASGAIFGILGAMMIGTYLANRKSGEGMWQRFILIFIMAIYSGSMNVDNAAHVGGFLTGIVITLIIISICNMKNKVSCRHR